MARVKPQRRSFKARQFSHRGLRLQHLYLRTFLPQWPNAHQVAIILKGLASSHNMRVDIPLKIQSCRAVHIAMVTEMRFMTPTAVSSKKVRMIGKRVTKTSKS